MHVVESQNALKHSSTHGSDAAWQTHSRTSAELCNNIAALRANARLFARSSRPPFASPNWEYGRHDTPAASSAGSETAPLMGRIVEV